MNENFIGGHRWKACRLRWFSSFFNEIWSSYFPDLQKEKRSSISINFLYQNFLKEISFECLTGFFTNCELPFLECQKLCRIMAVIKNNEVYFLLTLFWSRLFIATIFHKNWIAIPWKGQFILLKTVMSSSFEEDKIQETWNAFINQIHVWQICCIW